METDVDAIVADLDEYESLVLRERWVDHRLRSKPLAGTHDWKPKKQKAVARLRAKGVLEAPGLDTTFVQPTRVGWKVINALAELTKAQVAMRGKNERQYVNAVVQHLSWLEAGNGGRLWPTRSTRSWRRFCPPSARCSSTASSRRPGLPTADGCGSRRRPRA